MAQEKVLSSRQIYSGRIVTLRLDAVQLDNGYVTEREIIEHPGAVVIVPFDDNGHVILVRQFRLATGGELLEIPAGTREPEEDADSCAQRELQEEIGYSAGRLELLGNVFPTPGYSTERFSLYRATSLLPSRLPMEADEQLQVVRLPVDELLRRIDTGEIRDGKTILGLLWALRHAPGE